MRRSHFSCNVLFLSSGLPGFLSLTLQAAVFTTRFLFFLRILVCMSWREWAVAHLVLCDRSRSLWSVPRACNDEPRKVDPLGKLTKMPLSAGVLPASCAMSGPLQVNYWRVLLTAQCSTDQPILSVKARCTIICWFGINVKSFCQQLKPIWSVRVFFRDVLYFAMWWYAQTEATRNCTNGCQNSFQLEHHQTVHSRAPLELTRSILLFVGSRSVVELNLRRLATALREFDVSRRHWALSASGTAATIDSSWPTPLPDSSRSGHLIRFLEVSIGHYAWTFGLFASGLDPSDRERRSACRRRVAQPPRNSGSLV